MDITQEVIKKIQDFVILVGVKPSAIYLGRREIRELETFYKRALLLDSYTDIDRIPDPLRIYGVTVYGVDKTDHIGVGCAS